VLCALYHANVRVVLIVESVLLRLLIIDYQQFVRVWFCCVVTRTRLTQIRKQARCKYLLLDEKRGDHNKHSQGKIIRLNQVKHQARCKSKNDLSQERTISEPENEQPKGRRVLRLSQIKRQARSKGNSTVMDVTEKPMDQSLPCNSFKGE